ncbi:hypothetical protein NCCP2495_10680 [Dietzia sp. NCCP-2495]|uniref:hypothetical protein n=1 Tax=Dietzia sp. NCCP-2495 TaxID=2934675 RepID=UPI0022301668|nr:hypothetical protein [Dietzia sp. NCCP-2495]GLB63190.1 hypothetical protein NCCP2495_10680 [Dietzia sp. NCCP-2495]
MSADRLRAEVPPVVTAAVGIVVALVSGIFGISAHGLAAGLAAGSSAVAPGSGDLLLVGGASVGIGAVTAALARHRPPLVTAGVGLLSGQGLVHLILSAGHNHGGARYGGAGHVGQSPLTHHAADPNAVRAAMDLGAAATAGHLASLLTPAMLGAHVAAVLVTLALVAVLSRTLAWVAARVAPLLAAVHLVVVAPLLATYDAHPPRARYFLTGGGTRAPPALV